MVSTVEDVLNIEDIVMVNNIGNDSANFKALDTENRLKPKAPAVKAPQQAEQAVASDSVSFSDTSKKLDELKASFAHVDEVDEIKVSYFKAAIESGSYEINSTNIASKMLNNVEMA